MKRKNNLNTRQWLAKTIHYYNVLTITNFLTMALMYSYFPMGLNTVYPNKRIYRKVQKRFSDNDRRF